MSVNQYSIIWADDECATLEKDRSIRQLFDVMHIEVLAFVPTSEALKDKLEAYKDRVDAVVIDGNFSKSDVEYLEKDDISGLIHTLSFIELFNSHRDVPFYLYTGRKVMLEELCKNGELDYFTSNNRLIQKGVIEQLAQRIIRDVDHIHSVEFMVKKKYCQLLNMASEVSPQCYSDLHQFLLDEARDKSYDKAVDIFTSLRKVLEQILDGCIKNDIIPQAEQMLFLKQGEYKNDKWSLNNFSMYWGGKNSTNYMPLNGIMPQTIKTTLWGLVQIVQDGSHSLNRLNLHVSEYVQETQRPFVFRACLYQVMDIINWYNETLKELFDGKMRPSPYKLIMNK